MRNYLKKDYNMPGEYNRGVTLLRAGAALVTAIILVFLSYVFVYSPPPLTYLENRSYTVVKTYTVKSTGSSRGASDKYKYWLTIQNNETGKEHHWPVKKKVLKRYTEGETVSLPVHSIGDSGKVFISLENNTDSKKAAREYYQRYPTSEMKMYMYTLMILMLAALLFLAAGTSKVKTAENHVFLPTEVDKLPQKLAKEIKQPDYDEIFDKKGKL